MPRPKPIAVAYDPEIDDPRRYSYPTNGSAVGAGESSESTLPEAYLTRAVEMIALAFWLGGQAATAILYSSDLSIISTYRAFGRSATSQLRTAYTVLPMTVGTIAFLSAVSAAILLLTTLREGYYSSHSPGLRYLPCAASLGALALLIFVNHTQFSAYTSGGMNIYDLLRLLIRLTYGQIGLLCLTAFLLAWLQNTAVRSKIKTAK